MNTDPEQRMAPGRPGTPTTDSAERAETERRYANAVQRRDASMQAVRDRLLSLLDPMPAPRRVVVVDDDPVFTRSLALYFDSDDIEVVTFSDPVAAVAYLTGEDSDSIVGAVVDLDLRHAIDGMDVLEHLPRGRVAWIATGLLPGDPLLDRAAERYAARVLLKPGTPDRFDELVGSFRERISVVH